MVASCYSLSPPSQVGFCLGLTMLLYVKNLNISESVWLHFFTFISVSMSCSGTRVSAFLAEKLHRGEQNRVNLRGGDGEMG